MMEDMNILFIVSDTFRWKNLGYNGDTAIITPNLDRLADKSCIFDRCYACSFPTMPARADLFTGRMTYTYMGWEPLASSEKVVTEFLASSGYNCAAIFDTPFLSKQMGYERGFSFFQRIPGQTGLVYREQSRPFEKDHCAPATMLAAERWLQHHRKEKFFLYIDTWDPHEMWDSPRWYVEKYYPEYDGRIIKPLYGLWRERGLSQEDLDISYACYRGEVSMVDRWIGFLLNGLEAMNLMEKTAIIFTSDHGFYFGEHGFLGKVITPKLREGNNINLNPEATRTLKPARESGHLIRSPFYEEVSHIPLLVKIPEIEPQRVKSLVSLPDLMPTILDLAATKCPETVQAQSIVPLVQGERSDNWDIVVTSRPLTFRLKPITSMDEKERRIQASLVSTITSRKWSLLYSIEGEPAELYNLTSDPNQKKNLIQENPDVAKDLVNKFSNYLKEVGTNPHLIKLRRQL